MEEFGFHQHIQQPTHAHGHTLDVVITRKHSIAVSNINILDPVLVNNSGQYKVDHKAVTFIITTKKPPRPEKNISFRRLNKIDEDKFNQDIKQLPIMQIQEANNISTYDLVELYNSSLKSLLDQHAPLQNKAFAIRQRFVCNTNELRDAKRKKRQLERKWQNSKLTVDHQIYRNQGIVINKILCKSERNILQMI